VKAQVGDLGLPRWLGQTGRDRTRVTDGVVKINICESKRHGHGGAV